MRATRDLIIGTVIIAWAGTAYGASLAPEEAKSHVGEKATVCGLIASTKFADRSRGEPTFLNLGKAYPNQVFTAVIFGSDRGKFGTPEISFQGKRVCVTGEIRSYRGKPEIILQDPKQLSEE
jgi:DNA/RNA endonuclease YhcR with UshA esterase domain